MGAVAAVRVRDPVGGSFRLLCRTDAGNSRRDGRAVGGGAAEGGIGVQNAAAIHFLTMFSADVNLPLHRRGRLVTGLEANPKLQRTPLARVRKPATDIAALGYPGAAGPVVRRAEDAGAVREPMSPRKRDVRLQSGCPCVLGASLPWLSVAGVEGPGHECTSSQGGARHRALRVPALWPLGLHHPGATAYCCVSEAPADLASAAADKASTAACIAAATGSTASRAYIAVACWSL